MTQPEGISIEEFALMADRAGLNMTPEELDDLKPLFESNLQHVKLLRSLDLSDYEMEMVFHPEATE